MNEPKASPILPMGFCLRQSRLLPISSARDVNGRDTAFTALTTSTGYRGIGDVIGGGHVNVDIIYDFLFWRPNFAKHK